MATNTVAWLLDNIGRATRWRSNTPFGDGCEHDCEGGVDIPMRGGTPIYALATGKLIGSGDWRGHSVVTQEVAGVGKLYYQHLDELSTIPRCANGIGCGGYVIQRGQLIGFSSAAVGEVEVGINPAWGGIWGPGNNGANWVGDPRAELKQIALTGGGITPLVDPNTCVDCNFSLGSCPSNQHCAETTGKPKGHGCCVPDVSAGDIIGSILPDWLKHPDWFRVLKFVLGIVGIIVGIAALFVPEAEQQLAKVAEVGAMA